MPSHTTDTTSQNGIGSALFDFLTNRNNLSGLASIGLSNAAINRLQGLGDTAKTQTENLYNKVASTGKFNPFTVTAGPGSVSFDKFGGATYTTDPSLANFQTDLTNNAQAAYNAIFNPTVDPVTGELTVDQRANRQNFINAITGKTDIAGNLLDSGGLTEREQMVRDFVGSDVSLTDPFTSAGIASREQDIFDRLQALREPGNEEARVNLDQQLFAQGRGGLRTAQYGGSPEELALQRAIQEQRSADAVTAITQARQEAMDLSNQRLAGLQEARAGAQLLSDQVLGGIGAQFDETNIGTAATSRMLQDAFLPALTLADLTSPSINAASIADAANRQLAGYQRDLGLGALNFDLATEQDASNIRLAQAESLIDLLLGQQNSGGGSGSSGNPIEINTEALAKALGISLPNR